MKACKSDFRKDARKDCSKDCRKDFRKDGRKDCRKDARKDFRKDARKDCRKDANRKLPPSACACSNAASAPSMRPPSPALRHWSSANWRT